MGCSEVGSAMTVAGRCRSMVASLMLSLFAIFIVASLSLSRTVKASVGKPVLKLHYRGSLTEKPKPYRIGLFVGEGGFYFSRLAGTDWEGNIYISDATEPYVCFLHCYNKQGKFLRFYGPFDAYAVGGVGVTKDGFIWLSLLTDGIVEVYREFKAPIVVYRKGERKPIAEWHKKLPQEVEAKIRKVLKAKGLPQQWETPVLYYTHGAIGPQAGHNQVVLMLTGGPMEGIKIHGQKTLRNSQETLRILWLLMSSDGKQCLEAKVINDDDARLHLAPNNRFWFVQYQYGLDRGHLIWTKLWVWEQGKEKGEPLLDTVEGKEPWIDKIVLDLKRMRDAWFKPLVRFDGKGNIYLILERLMQQGKQNSFDRFIVEGKELNLGPNAIPSEMALVVLNKEKKLVTYLPWTTPSLEMNHDWIHPLPDGSGFYRIEYRKREAVIYFHPLPSQKR